MTNLGPPRLRDPGVKDRARLCLLGIVGYPPMIYALGPGVGGDLRALFALNVGVRIDQVRLLELEPGGAYEIGELIAGWTDPLPTLVSANPERWSDGSGEE